MMTFGEWCNEIELRYDRLPRWYLDTARRVTAFREYQTRFDEDQPRLSVELSIAKGELDGRSS